MAASDGPAREHTGPRHAGARPVVVGVVRSMDGEALPGAVLTLADPAGREVDRTRAGADGGFTLVPPGAGTYLVVCAAGAHRPGASMVVVETGTVQRDLVLAADPAALVPGALTGQVRSASSGRPVPEATVTAVDPDGTVAGTALTGPDGGYLLAGLPPGRYTLVASGYAPVAQQVEVSGGAADRGDVLLGDAGPDGPAPSTVEDWFADPDLVPQGAGVNGNGRPGLLPGDGPAVLR